MIPSLSPIIALLTLANALPAPEGPPDPSKDLNYLPKNGLYTEIYRGNTTAQQAWGAFVDKTDQVLSPAALGTLANACFSPINALCRYVNDHISDETVRDRWVWAMSYGPGCVAGVFLPVNHVPDPNYSQCRAYVDAPMRTVLDQAASQGFNRVSVNLQTFPELPALEDLLKTFRNGAVRSTDDRHGSPIDGTITSWLMEG